MTILSVEDEPQLAGQIARALRQAGHEVESVGDGPGAVARAVAQHFDMVVLDVNLPGFDGFEVLRRLRENAVSSRVLMLTARAEIADRVTGLKGGADDYVTKPFALAELLARVEVLGRRGGRTESGDVLRVAGVCLDTRTRRVTRGGETIALSPREFEVLQVLMNEPGRIFSRDEICERIWQREHEYDTRTVEIFVMRLRKKLDDGSGKPLIETVRGVGYRLLRE